MNSDRLNEFDLNAYLQRQWAAIDRALEQSPQQYSGEWQTIFRPNLVLATGELFGATQSSSLPFACPVELIHAYSLIHDDLPALDDDDLRQAGLPGVWRRRGLAGRGGLLTEALHLMSGPDVTRRVPAELSHAVGVAGLVGGQALDLEAESDTDVYLAAVEWIHVRKTGALILASIRAGARWPGGRGTHGTC